MMVLIFLANGLYSEKINTTVNIIFSVIFLVFIITELISLRRKMQVYGSMEELLKYEKLLHSKKSIIIFLIAEFFLFIIALLLFNILTLPI